jgi:hypothetical protein
MKLKIWGVRGSVPAPLAPQAIRDKIIAALQDARGVDRCDPMAVRACVDGLPAFQTVGTGAGSRADGD